MIKNILFISLTFFILSFSAQNFTATFGFQDVTNTSGNIDPSTSPEIDGLVFGAFSAKGCSPNPNASGRFSYTNWPLGGVNGTDDYSNFLGTLSPVVYYEVTITVSPLYTLSLNSATFTMRRSGTGIRNYCVRSSLDYYNNNLAAVTGTNTRLSVTPGNVFFWNYDSVATSTDQRGSAVNLGSAFASITNSITFRVYAWNAESAGGSFSIDNFSFIGSVTNSLTIPNLVGFTATLNKTKELKVFPNPVFNGVIVLEGMDSGEKVEIISLFGDSLLVEQIKTIENQIHFNTSDLANGIYFMKIYNGNSVTVHKFIILQR